MTTSFPTKLWDILENEDPSIIHWHPDGGAFKIADLPRFEREIIPKYFRHTQFSSVKRQLNLYGFRLIQRGENKGYFFQQSFRRDDILTAQNLVRVATPKKKRVCSGGNMSAAKLAKQNRTSKLNATSDAMLDDILHGSSFKFSKSDSEEESEDENETNESQQFSHQLGIDLKSVSLFYDGKPIKQEDLTSYGTASGPIPIIVRYPQVIKSTPPPKMEPMRPSALSSRLGFNMDLLSKFRATAKFEPHQPQQSTMFQHQPVQQNQHEQPVNRFQTYSDIDLLDSELYRIGPPLSTATGPCEHESCRTTSSTIAEDGSESMGEDCKQLTPKMIYCPGGDGDGRSISVEDMLAFLDRL